MKNLWPTKFEPNSLPAPKTILEEQAGFLGTITGGIVIAEVSPLSQVDAITFSLRNEFVFRLELVGPFLENYRFTVLHVSHDIALYPVKGVLDESIAKELGIKKSLFAVFEFSAGTPEEFEAFLERVLQSERLKSIVGSILSLSK